ncbi:tRNA guanosine(34) transglycosylase Tgt [Thermomicrobium sp. 4228-Ro]|uniref:tRNA guanosine(34) transglycosylase Tgt n=1 Tax=Thermomicrobium sp. 4228-Ro TaxID=2993937 RepID=UPI002248CEAF|nr:tRNA guanosine(34) transglycosylase Tgt [Thermomicrobium sp. 4228-Ro]MCX2726105.1 tRNA guanosine(34) transglycosylase Tgt [Thermomicrobium sp. 4228-Ro]
MTRFTVLKHDTTTRARLGLLLTRRGPVHTPAFMPVGTQATVKSLTPEEVRATGSEIILANTYHLLLRPGPAVFEAVGDLHTFMRWDGPILTDSGGFQVFSLAKLRTVSEQGVTFRSHIDGSLHELTPETVIDLQLVFGSDIIMPLDDVVGYGEPESRQVEAMQRTHRWLSRALDYFVARTMSSEPASRPLLFGIAQGGFRAERRRTSAEFVASLPLDGIAIGGLSVGEPKQELYALLQASLDPLPEDRPRYLMGVGAPEDLWRAVSLGVDLFDCVLPTRLARHGALFTENGRIDILAVRFKFQREPVDPCCDCYTCQHYSAAYLHHLFRAKELLAYRLATIHNLRFIQNQMARMRTAIAEGTFAQAMEAFLTRYGNAEAGYAGEPLLYEGER